MVNSPEEYFSSQDFSPNSSGGDYTPAERLFIQKYLGMDEDDLIDGLAIKPATTDAEAIEMPSTENTNSPAGLDFISQSSFELENDAALDNSATQSAPAVVTEAAIEMQTDTPEETTNMAEAVAVSIPEPVIESDPEPQLIAEPAPEPGKDIDPETISQQAAESSALPELATKVEPEAAPEQIIAEELVVQGEPEIQPEPMVKPTVEEQSTPESVAVEEKVAEKSAPNVEEELRKDYKESVAQEEYLETILKQEEFCQMVGFYIGDQEFVVPTMAMQEVIRYDPPIRIPMAPSFVEGVITLRGRVTPVVKLRDMLGVTNKELPNEKCIIICQRRGLQLGFLVEKIHTMYRTPQKDLEWGVEAQLGINADVDFISAVMKSEDGSRLMGMLSVDRIIEFILR